MAATLGTSGTYVGYGINIFKGPHISDAVLSPLFSDDVYADASNNGINKYIDAAKNTEARWTAHVSKKLSDVFTSLESDVTFGTGKDVPFLAGSIGVQIKNSANLRCHAHFYRCIYYSTVSKHLLIASHNLSDLIAQKNLNTINGINRKYENNKDDFENIFSTIGTHIITGCFMGGDVLISGLYNSYKKIETKNIEAALNIESAYANSTANTKEAKQQKEIVDSMKMEMSIKGGDTHILSSSMNFYDLLKKIESWAGTISNSPVIAKIKTVVPVWELVTDGKRKKAMKDYFDEKIDAVIKELEYASPDPNIEGGCTYIIRNVASGEVLDGNEGSRELNAPVIVYPDKGKNKALNQRWKLVEHPDEPGCFMIQNCNSLRSIAALSSEHETGLFQHSDLSKTSTVMSDELFKIEKIKDEEGKYFISFHNKETLRISAPYKTRHVILAANAKEHTKWKFEKQG